MSLSRSPLCLTVIRPPSAFLRSLSVSISIWSENMCVLAKLFSLLTLHVISWLHAHRAESCSGRLHAPVAELSGRRKGHVAQPGPSLTLYTVDLLSLLYRMLNFGPWSR